MTQQDVGSVMRMIHLLGYAATAEQIAARLQIVMDDSDSGLFVADDGGEVVGWVHVNQVTVLQTGSFAGVAGLAVADGRQGAGIGSALLEAAEEWGRRRGHTLMRIRSNVIRDAAHEFYRKRGYEPEKQLSSFTKSL